MDGKIVLPGEVVFDSPQEAQGTFVEDGKTFVSTLGLLREGKFIPLKGRYLPKRGDYVVGVVAEERFSGYSVDLNSPYEGSISSRDTREEFEQGDVVSAQIIDVNEIHEATLTEARKLYGGRLIEIEPVKVPRVIGRNASMLETIKEFTGSTVFVGKNGRVYLKGGDIPLAVMAILKICREAHISGLTERVNEFLKSESQKKNGGLNE
ncbi:MAG: exosome complex protein Rrp4 [Candidatus Micrarchaeota archaeon]